MDKLQVCMEAKHIKNTKMSILQRFPSVDFTIKTTLVKIKPMSFKISPISFSCSFEDLQQIVGNVNGISGTMPH